MCGIVAYIGFRPALPILMDGLKKMEYKGYDSSGIGLLDSGKIKTVKAVGKIKKLEEKLEKDKLEGFLGICHTRWATHGEPTEANAHPHLSANGKIAVVHNGIVENYALLKKRLQADGVQFVSETDTEVLAHWIAKFYEGDLSKAVLEALQSIEGTFGIAVICSDEPDVLIGARRGSPLLIGVGENESFLTSDVSAVVGHTKKIVHLEDNDVIIIGRQNFEIKNIKNKSVNREIQEIKEDLELAQKGDYPHFMLKEIFEQPEPTP